MANLDITERYDFQQWILKDLIQYNGYIQRAQSAYSQRLAMDIDILWEFLMSTQEETVEKLLKRFDRETILNLINQEIIKGGLLFALKDGVYIENKKLRLMYRRPATDFNEKASHQYNLNRLTVMEEVVYKDQERIDLVIFLNGLALFAIELKLNSSGQSVQDAIKQLKGRDVKNRLFRFNAGVLVSFAVDWMEVYMTTQLKGSDTYFLPFNKGKGEGIDQGAGNPQNNQGPETEYLWRDLLKKESILQLIERFIFLTPDKKDIIFPRYQQRRAVNRILEDMRVNHTDRNYLIQHSAGSGKTNTIAWLAHSLVSLHDEENQNIVDTVLVVTDRIVVDRQLQDAIRSIEHQPGVIKVMDDKATSSDLADALAGNTKIVATTIHKFAQINKSNWMSVSVTAEKKFAILIDEAHSSTTGSYMSAVSQVLTETDIENGTMDEPQEVSVGDAIEQEIARTGKQDNISIIAFTATPKATTLQLFGSTRPDGSKVPFDLYSMKQAIEEGFILDVLNNYTTYKTYYKLNKAVEEDPELKTTVAKRKIAKFVELSDENIHQKVEIIMDHFITHDIMADLGGHGKAMIVTSGREAAVKYQQAFKKYLKEHHITSIGAAVAFSGRLSLDGAEFSESSMNGFSEDKLKSKFDTDDYQVLIVANKYQTGFDQPKLLAMYVDKKLRDVAAVQTLSRLNRIVKGYHKKTFILDFKNTYEDINRAFAPYYRETILTETITPSDVFDLDAKIESYGIVDNDDVHAYNQFLYQEKRSSRDKQKMLALLSNGYARVQRFDEKEQVNIRKVIRGFLRMYTFLIQATAYQNELLHERYNYLQGLVKMIDVRLGGNDFTIADKIVVDYMKHKQTGFYTVAELEGNYSVTLNKPNLSNVSVEQEKKLSEIIEEINEQLDLDIDDQIAVSGAVSIRELMKKNPKLKQSALVNSREDFEFSFEDEIDKALTDGYTQNQDFFGVLLSNEDFKKRIAKIFIDDVYQSFKKSGD
ncbi:DEAD/DEAH box helicase family protein [Streptococcus sp. SG1]|jgi:type I site-specific restriction-modification system, R (restriction) subunit and related helicases|uniref:type I restriction endonuclease subunit R n=1 Tax=Streptococcus TaxID=1301 RepID=UPI0009C29B89|nr:MULTISPECIES: DEAD/DEAH box helicase family protein [Streptococcus]ARC45994.1 type I restriction endonuclease subunit R [Streptococcus gordonii]MDN5018963.1 DEAD/DEAH box helicase family protein [Streptococcus sp. SG1]RSJ52837.1 Type-1 restriction enzyme R protein [Streptococcus gordonii]RSJ64840.1 Type-1 restriction enzyme R protein [Streptococcus gordonii]